MFPHSLPLLRGDGVRMPSYSLVKYAQPSTARWTPPHGAPESMTLAPMAISRVVRDSEEAYHIEEVLERERIWITLAGKRGDRLVAVAEVMRRPGDTAYVSVMEALTDVDARDFLAQLTVFARQAEIVRFVTLGVVGEKWLKLGFRNTPEDVGVFDVLQGDHNGS